MTHTHTTYHEAVHAALHLLADDMGYEIPTHADIAQVHEGAPICAPS